MTRKSVLVLTTETSASGSVWRAASALAGDILEPVTPITPFYETGRFAELRRWAPSQDGQLLMFNSPHNLDPEFDLTRCRFVLNARDPRDIACNQFAWEFYHHKPSDKPGDLEARAQAAAAEGVDAYALRRDYRAQFRPYHRIVRDAPPGSWMFVGYAAWCLLPDETMARLAAFLGVDPAALPAWRRQEAAAERTPVITSNPHWTGNHWQGSDTAPGRHRRELKRETIAILTERYAAELALLARIDDTRMGWTYY